jgi:hypothetical protein
MMVLIIAPSFSMAQNIAWERTFTDSTFLESIQGVAIDSDQYIYAAGGNRTLNFESQRRIFKFDTVGNEIWGRTIKIDSASESGLDKIVKIKNENNFYVSGRSEEPFLYNYDFLAKIDTAADTIWVRRFSYPTFYYSIKSFVVLNDKSVVTVGEKLTINAFDIVYRRIDSLGNLMWEETYSLAGDQFGFNITEMMDGSMIIAGRSDADHLLMRIGFDGRLINNTVISISNGTPRFNQVSPDQGNNLVFTGYDYISVNNFKGKFLRVDSAFNKKFEKDESPGSWAFNVRTDSLFNRLQYSSGPPYVAGVAIYNDTSEISSVLFPNDGDYRLINTMSAIGNNQMIIVGYKDTVNSQNYWLAKIDGVGEEWIPDPCAFSPPVAGFDYNLDGGLLTLLDTSYSGLPYLDTIYTWQWTFGNGLSDTTESPLTLWDTASAPTLDVELIVSNWYGCIDTLQTTLVANPVGTGIIAQTQFEEKVWPNPARDILHINLSENTHQEQVFKIYDVHGRKLMQSSFSGKEGQMNISALPTGIYFYKLSIGGIVKRGKVVKH